jgi:glycosyltransferase involved in cell wall biosynthesis
MKKNIKTVTIGIPAYNEEANIGLLLDAVVQQKQKDFKLVKVIVISDASTDNTDDIVQKIGKNKKISFIKGHTRKGVSYRLNQIIKKSNSDILVILDADILPKGFYFLEKLVTPIINEEADLTSAALVEVTPANIVESILIISMQFKKQIFEEFRGGDNIYTCHGPARAFSKRLYKSLFLPQSIGQDAFTYLHCKFNQMKYCYVPKAKVIYRVPTNIGDHKKQSNRFDTSKRLFNNIFGESFVKKQYRLPFAIMLSKYSLNLWKHPIKMGLYTIIFLAMKLTFIFQSNKVSQTWEMVTSSKKLR